ncbi:uncharacterized protein LOC106151231 [Lingula anatina]|uniref:Uncharacterized protein LOC106151231 n=1 Tax=Lingula anatina TaxID=7574 RepID=A0A1S3H2W4_LINAN|nr:uncharacterized protein LOC106151231 [Lingula anatina]|eukprot:XP_013379821.1 uncharacterized protein LOC106151231 [Lingula anatina]
MSAINGIMLSSRTLVLMSLILFTANIDWKYVSALPGPVLQDPRPLWQPSNLEFVTFNTGLHAADVPEYESRRDAFLDTVTNAGIPGDVVCLQEVWEADDLRAIVRAARSQFPYSFSALHVFHTVLSDSSSTPACEKASISKVILCLSTKCTTLTGLQGAVCALTACKEGLASLSQDCLSCINRIFASSQVANLTLGDFQARIRTCLGTPYPTTFGLLLLSKKPLVDPEVINYHEGSSLLLPRGYIKAKIDAYQIFCTHLTSELNKYIYLEVGPFTSFKEQSLFEMDSLLKASWPNYVNSILIGDFNSNPAIPANDISGSLTDTYDLVSQWYFSPYLMKIGKCTYCAENPLIPSARRFQLNKLYDHIFVPKFCWWSWEKLEDARRILDSNIKNKGFPLSDHYGVSVTFEKWSWQLQ